jgi:hypothetical protein
MYWIFLILFITAILIPDIIRGSVYSLTETRAEEVAIFLMGATAFLVFVRNELQLTLHKKEKEKDEKKINQTVKDLVESYSYIGEVNRKMDILMSIALGLTDRSVLNKKREKEIYEAIISASNFLMKADFTCLRFIHIASLKTEREIGLEGKSEQIKNSDLANIPENNNVKKTKDRLILASSQTINDVRGYFIINDYDEEEEKNPKNIEILKVFISQALFLYSYVNLSDSSGNTVNK